MQLVGTLFTALSRDPQGSHRPSPETAQGVLVCAHHHVPDGEHLPVVGLGVEMMYCVETFSAVI